MAGVPVVVGQGQQPEPPEKAKADKPPRKKPNTGSPGGRPREPPQFKKVPDGYSTDMDKAAFFRLKDDFHSAEDAAGRDARPSAVAKAAVVTD